MARVLVVDGQADVHALLKDVLSKAGHHVVIAETTSAALALHAARPVSLVIADASLPDGKGLDLLRAFHQAHPEILLAAMAGNIERTGAFTEALRIGAMVLLSKPLVRQEVHNLVREMLPPEGPAPPTVR